MLTQFFSCFSILTLFPVSIFSLRSGELTQFRWRNLLSLGEFWGGQKNGRKIFIRKILQCQILCLQISIRIQCSITLIAIIRHILCEKWRYSFYSLKDGGWTIFAVFHEEDVKDVSLTPFSAISVKVCLSRFLNQAVTKKKYGELTSNSSYSEQYYVNFYCMFELFLCYK